MEEDTHQTDDPEPVTRMPDPGHGPRPVAPPGWRPARTATCPSARPARR